MRTLTLRIYITVVAALALFALVSGWLVKRHVDELRGQAEVAARERVEMWADLLERSLPPASAPIPEQNAALQIWSQRLRMPMALEDANGRRIATSESFARREDSGRPQFLERVQAVRLDDGRTLRLPRPTGRPTGALGGGMRGAMGTGVGPMVGASGREAGAAPWWAAPHLAFAAWPKGVGLLVLLVLLFAAVALGAWPVARHLTRRLNALKSGVEAFGAGHLQRRVEVHGTDEVAAVATSFNQAADRIEALLQSHQSLLANASHELRSPLARLKMALSMAEEVDAAQRARLQREIHTNIAELDALVDEVLLSSRLQATSAQPDQMVSVDLLGLAAEEGARVQASASGPALVVAADERLLRRAVRNLMENAQRYGGSELSAHTQHGSSGQAELWVCDRGQGVPPAERERIFEPFYRLPGHAERAGGVGLGLALVRQIALRHGGQVRCEARAGGGSCFVLALPLAPAV